MSFQCSLSQSEYNFPRREPVRERQQSPSGHADLASHFCETHGDKTITHLKRHSPCGSLASGARKLTGFVKALFGLTPLHHPAAAVHSSGSTYYSVRHVNERRAQPNPTLCPSGRARQLGKSRGFPQILPCTRGRRVLSLPLALCSPSSAVWQQEGG